jgi:hypothetical protein
MTNHKKLASAWRYGENIRSDMNGMSAFPKEGMGRDAASLDRSWMASVARGLIGTRGTHAYASDSLREREKPVREQRPKKGCWSWTPDEPSVSDYCSDKSGVGMKKKN